MDPLILGPLSGPASPSKRSSGAKSPNSRKMLFPSPPEKIYCGVVDGSFQPRCRTGDNGGIRQPKKEGTILPGNYTPFIFPLVPIFPTPSKPLRCACVCPARMAYILFLRLTSIIIRQVAPLHTHTHSFAPTNFISSRCSAKGNVEREDKD